MSSLLQVLDEARDFGFFGPGPVSAQYEHALGFIDVVGPLPADAMAVDLGSGGGVPGLVVAAELGVATTLVESMQRRAAFLRSAVERLGLAHCRVVEARAEDVARSHLRGMVQVVTARGFGPPAMTAECGVPLLRPGGRLIVSEPPDEGVERWPLEGLALLGAEILERTEARGAGYRQIVRVGEVDEKYPRASGRPRKRPLF